MNRREQIEDFVTSSRAELQLGGMNERTMGATVEQWSSRLRFIPDDYLDDCYKLAMDNHGTRSPLLPKEIVDQWRIVSARPGFRDRRGIQEKTCPHYCSLAGWIIVNASGVLQMEFGTSEYLYAKPCPIHRPQGFRPDPHAGPPGPRLPRVETSHEGHLKKKPNAGEAEGWKSAGQVGGQMDIPEPRSDDDEDRPESAA